METKLFAMKGSSRGAVKLSDKGGRVLLYAELMPQPQQPWECFLIRKGPKLEQASLRPGSPCAFTGRVSDVMGVVIAGGGRIVSRGGTLSPREMDEAVLMAMGRLEQKAAGGNILQNKTAEEEKSPQKTGDGKAAAEDVALTEKTVAFNEGVRNHVDAVQKSPENKSVGANGATAAAVRPVFDPVPISSAARSIISESQRLFYPERDGICGNKEGKHDNRSGKEIKHGGGETERNVQRRSETGARPQGGGEMGVKPPVKEPFVPRPMAGGGICRQGGTPFQMQQRTPCKRGAQGVKNSPSTTYCARGAKHGQVPEK